MKKFLASMVAGLALGASPALACEPILDILLFSDEIPGKCPVPTTTPSFNQTLCLGGPCRNFGGSDKGQFGQLKKDAPGRIEALFFQLQDVNVPMVETNVVQLDNVFCQGDPQIPTQTGALNKCDATYKVRGIRPDGADLNAPLCTFDSIAKINILTTTVGVPLVDLNGSVCTSRNKSQYWLYYRICCEPGSVFGNQGDELDIKAALVISDGGTCKLDPVRSDATPEVIPTSDSSPCL